MNRRAFLKGAASALAGAALLTTIPDGPEVWTGIVHGVDMVIDRPIILDDDVLLMGNRFRMRRGGVFLCRNRVRMVDNYFTYDGVYA